MKKNNILICWCGHTQEKHSNYYSFPICSICVNILPDRGADWRHEFKMDNLKYLEGLADA